MASNQWAGEKAEDRTTCGRKVYIIFHTTDILPHLVVAELGAQFYQPAGLAGLAVRQLCPALAEPQQSHTVPERGGDKPAERSQTTLPERNLARDTRHNSCARQALSHKHTGNFFSFGIITENLLKCFVGKNT